MTNYVLIAEGSSNLKIHEAELLAIQEAQRLCRKENKRIFVYKAICEVKPSALPVEVVKYDED